MIKKALLVTAGVGLLAVVLFGWDAASYVSTSYDRVTDSVRSSVPIEFQIDRARRMVDKLDGEIRKCSEVVAKEEVELKSLNRRIEEVEAKNVKDKANVLRLQDRFDDSIAAADEAISIARQAVPEEHIMPIVFRANRAHCLAIMGRYAEAESDLQQSYRDLVDRFGAGHRRTQKVAAQLADLYAAWNRPADAAHWATAAAAPTSRPSNDAR